MKIEEYAKKRDEMLMKRSTEALKQFVNDNSDCFSLMFINGINRASEEVLELTLHKTIVHCINLPFDFRQESADWLLDRGFSLELKSCFNIQR